MATNGRKADGRKPAVTRSAPVAPASKPVDGPTPVPPALSATNTVDAPRAVAAKPAPLKSEPARSVPSDPVAPEPVVKAAATKPAAPVARAPEPAKTAVASIKASVVEAAKAVATPIIEAVAAPAAPASPVAEPAATTPTAAPAATSEAKEPIMATVIDNAQNAAQSAAQDTSAKAQAMFSDMTERSKGAVEKSQKLFADATEFGKGNVEALVESSKIAARGIESMSHEAVAYAKSSFEQASEAMKTLSSVKSPSEFMKLQADYARSAFDAMMAQTSKSTEASLKLAGEVAQPISNRIAVAADKIKVAA